MKNFSGGRGSARGPLDTRAVLEGWLAVPIQAKLIEVHLMGPTGEALRRWRFTGAYPVRWSVDSFSSTQQELALEMVELAYSTVERVP